LAVTADPPSLRTSPSKEAVEAVIMVAPRVVTVAIVGAEVVKLN
jgi:hypothetical protein